ncbi:hypothetical protein [Enterococcus casseliflavus]|uniref:Phage abortive infection protein n=1 Tax=Enterococcus casseliflavus TaxID=37734 RepID=A0ABD5FPS1_ENTCA|nr:hypothetical protein [Enterococcus casseliflavus]MDT2984066.1 hypothetical protein [Enterococcus casseliflavus]
MIKKGENNIGGMDEKISGIGGLILKHKFGTIFIGIVLPIITLFFIKITFVNNINIFDWYSLVLGILSFLVGILVLESISEKEKALEAMKEIQRSTTIEELFQSSKSIINDFLEYDKNFEGFKKQSKLNMRTHHALMGDLAKLTYNYNFKIDNYDNLLNFVNEVNVNWFKSKNPFESYIDLIKAVHTDLLILSEEYNNSQYDKNMGDRLK